MDRFSKAGLAASGASSRSPAKTSASRASATAKRPLRPGVQLLRQVTRARFLDVSPRLSSNAARWRQIAVELVDHWDLVDPRVAAILKAMRADLFDGSPAGWRYRERLANALAVYLVGRYGLRPPAPRSDKGGMPGQRLRRVLDYIGENLTRHLGVTELAAVAGMSPHYFSELFRRSVGRSPHQYVLSRRIERAKAFLRDSKRSVLEAGSSAGFANPSHFARAFRRLVGVSPRQFRDG